ncbi:MAG: hypothetical protein R2838_16190 [Caldilineaceae bacterium]
MADPVDRRDLAAVRRRVDGADAPAGGPPSSHTIYRRRPLHGRDWLVIGAAAFTAGIFVVPLPGVDRGSLYYLPYPQLTLPPLSLALETATWGC